MPKSSNARDPGNEPLDGQQLCSLEMVIGHVARSREEKPEAVQKRLEERYGAGHFSKIAQADYRDAVEFLIDLNMEGRQSKK